MFGSITDLLILLGIWLVLLVPVTALVSLFMRVSHDDEEPLDVLPPVPSADLTVLARLREWDFDRDLRR